MSKHNGEPVFIRGGADAGRGDDPHGVTPKWTIKWNGGRVMGPPHGELGTNEYGNFDGGWEIINNENLENGAEARHSLEAAEDFLHNSGELDYEVIEPTDAKERKRSRRYDS